MVSQVNALREIRGIREKAPSVGNYRAYSVYRVGGNEEEPHGPEIARRKVLREAT